ncbi:predicted protein [Nematostella vectensis]|uniref:USP domain-containing protein n=1 Tax=Nematostella vectensis TaxID=45351 RepID=A7SU60_NEMVE|nr:predicted protein [Nematostella vectensis]|eukprot:XP_001624868.1 predicted protein [Nematostella vectensis]
MITYTNSQARFTRVGTKVTAPVKFQDTISIGDYCAENTVKDSSYVRKAVVVHSGTYCTNGHNTAYCSENRQWFNIDDVIVSTLAIMSWLFREYGSLSADLWFIVGALAYIHTSRSREYGSLSADLWFIVGALAYIHTSRSREYGSLSADLWFIVGALAYIHTSRSRKYGSLSADLWFIVGALAYIHTSRSREYGSLSADLWFIVGALAYIHTSRSPLPMDHYQPICGLLLELLRTYTLLGPVNMDHYQPICGLLLELLRTYTLLGPPCRSARQQGIHALVRKNRHSEVYHIPVRRPNLIHIILGDLL